MKRASLFSAWGIMFSICAVLGFIPASTAAARWLFGGISVLFFLPPALLLKEASDTGDRKLLNTMILISALSLGLTLVLLVCNILAVLRSDGLGLFLHALLAIVSVPMLSSQLWALSLFCWASILVAGMMVRKRRI